MIARKLRDFLDGEGVKYTVVAHSQAYTAQEIAALVHVPGHELAKAVIVKIDGNLAIAVAPSSCHIDLELLRRDLAAKKVVLASETEFRDRFPDCETGAMPPFGHLYGMKTYVEATLAGGHEIAFNAGTHRELIRMAYLDYERLAKPVVLEMATLGL